MASFSSVMRYFLIIVYSAGIVALGAHDLAQRYSQAPNASAKLAPSAVKDDSNAGDSNRKRSNEAKQRAPAASPPSDALTRSDRKELEQLLEEVVP